MVEPLRHRQTKGAATDMFYLTPPRHISTLPRRPSLAHRRSLKAWAHRSAGWYEAGFQIAPQRHHQLAGQRHDGDLADPPLDLADPLAEPAAQIAIRLMPQPQPGKLDRGRSRAVVARLADTLLPPAGAAVVGRVGQSDAATDLTSVLEVTIEHLVGQNLGDLRTDGLELGKLNGLRLHRAFCRRTMRSCVLRFECLDLLVHQQQPLMLAADLFSQPRRQGAPVTGMQPLEIR